MNSIERSSFLGFYFSILITIFAITMSVNAGEQADITLAQIEKDLNFLASDEMAGRGNFSEEIELAAKYIANRFSEFGLTGTSESIGNIRGFKQSFSVFQLKPKVLQVTLNGRTIISDNIMAVSNQDTLHWNDANNTNSSNKIKTHVLKAKDNPGQLISKLNLEGGLHFILMNNHHEAIFSRYRQFFHRGLTKVTLGEPGAIIVVLSDQEKIETFEVNSTFDVKKKTLTNVVGVLPGHSKPNEIVLFSAHYDHLGVLQPAKDLDHENNQEKGNKEDWIYNGADDDASGTTAVLSLARYFAQINNNARSLVFVTFAGEEIGGFGSKFFSNQLSPDKIIAMINIEMIGKPSKFGSGKTWMTGADRSNLFELLNKRLAKIGKEIFAGPYSKQRLFYRSDNATLAKLGVPAHSFSSTQIDKDQYYHQVSDEVETLHIKSMHSVIKTLAESVKGLVDGFDTPSRIELSVVRPKGKIY